MQIIAQCIQDNGVIGDLLYINFTQKKKVIMKHKKTNSLSLAEDQLINELYNIIENRRNTLKRIASLELVTLFWNIGSELNNLLNKKNKPQPDKNIVRILSESISIRYGPYFTERSLKKMQLFAVTFPDFTKLQNYVHLLSWEHILVLLKLKNQYERQFYLTLKIREALSVNELKKVIAVNEYDIIFNNHYSKGRNIISSEKGYKNFRTPDITIELLIKNDQRLPNLFKRSRISSFRQLLAPRKSERKSSENLIGHESITQIIEEYRKRQNNSLNTNFNMLLWEVGKSIGQNNLLEKPKSEIKSIINILSAQFQKDGKVFLRKQLQLMLQFAERFPTPEEASYISYLVTWEHIMILLSFQDLNDWLFYIQIVIEKGLNANDLKKLILKKPPQHTSDTKKNSQKLLSLRKFYKTTIVSTKPDHYNISIKMINLEYMYEKKYIPNIFKNQYFEDFATKA
jgi:hypothetical protein